METDWNRPLLRAVFDTNVVVFTLVFGRRLAWLRHAWTAKRMTPVVCRQTVNEVLRVFAYPKFRLDSAERLLLLEDYLPFAEVVAMPDPPALPVECRDRTDAIFLQLALASGADALVSGDADLTSLRNTAPIPILSAMDPKTKLQERDAPSGPA